MVTKIPGRTLYVKIEPVSDLEITEFKVNGAKCTNAEIASGKVITITNPGSDSKTTITYSAKDKLGNGGDTSTFTIQFDKVPEITGINCNQEGETLKKDDKLTLQISFDKFIKVTGTPKIQVECYKNNANKTTWTLNCTTTSGEDTSTLYFETTIPEGVEYDNVKVVQSSSKWINLSGGTIKRGEIDANLGGTVAKSSFDVTIDSLAPTITGYEGMRTGSTANYTKTSNSVNITFKFSEPVTAQNGYITIYRKGSEDVTGTNPHTWHIPAVISADVFEKIWNNSTDGSNGTTDYRTILSGSNTTKSVNGPDAYGVPSLVSKGPYKMYTNGLVLNENPIYQYVSNNGKAEKSKTVIHAANSVMVPDLTTKYVLDWQYNTNETSGVVANLRAALEAVNYHKTIIPLSRLTFTNGRTKATLTIKDSDFIDEIREGVVFIMEIPTNSFVDDVQNVSTSTEYNSYEFTVGNVAKPVIRVNRWSTNDNSKLAPDDETVGKARVKIDCETPGAAIEYQLTNLTINTDYNTDKSNYQRNLTPPDYNPGPVGTTASASTTKTPGFNNVSSLEGAGGSVSFSKSDNYTFEIEATQNYSTDFSVGDGSADTGQRIYIVAKATSTNADLQASENAYEGAFKTVLYANTMITDASWNTSHGKTYIYDNFKIFACQTPEGKSSTAGWPLSMRDHNHDTDTTNGTRDCYKLAYHIATNSADYKWMSWELISDDLFTITTLSWNFQKAIDSLASYGSCIWMYKLDTWGMDY